MSIDLQEQLNEELMQLMEQHQTELLKEKLMELHPYDIAAFFLSLPEELDQEFLKVLTVEQAAGLVQELDTDEQVRVLTLMGAEKAVQVLNRMENDDLADMLAEVTEEQRQEILKVMLKEESENVQKLLSFDPETAGGIMTNRFVWLKQSFTVSEAVSKIKSFAEYAENIYYLYAINDQKQLAGVLSYRDLILAEPNERIENIMSKRVISVPTDAKQEEVAKLFERYDFIAVPVVDEEQKLLGIVTVDDIIDVMIEEAEDDYAKLAASGKSIDFNTGAWTAAMRRLPWLILLLFLGLLSGTVLSTFENTLQQVVALAFFMPMIAGMTGNTGTQSLAIVIRGLTNQDLPKHTVWKLIARELGVGLFIGLVCGLLAAVIAAWIFQDNIYLSLVIGLSLFLTLVIGTLAGTIIPILLYRINIDPAIASGPLITTLNDVFSLTVYFGTATLFISYLT